MLRPSFHLATEDELHNGFGLLYTVHSRESLNRNHEKFPGRLHTVRDSSRGVARHIPRDKPLVISIVTSKVYARLRTEGEKRPVSEGGLGWVLLLGVLSHPHKSRGIFRTGVESLNRLHAVLKPRI